VPGGDRRSQEDPGGATRSRKESGGSRRSQHEPDGERRSRKVTGGSQEEPGKGGRSQKEPGGIFGPVCLSTQFQAGWDPAQRTHQCSGGGGMADRRGLRPRLHFKTTTGGKGAGPGKRNCMLRSGGMADRRGPSAPSAFQNNSGREGSRPRQKELDAVFWRDG
jgi:hypothetical protein